MKNGVQLQVKIIVVGARQVGKSALTVRYLTRRYIGEYKSHTDLSYRQMFSLDGNSVEVEIVDVSNQPGDTSLPLARIKNCDACVIVYSIADRNSFRTAHEALVSLRANGVHRSLDKNNTSSDLVPIVLLANKKDLDHLRQVTTVEGRELARRFRCIFCEVSAAEAETEPDITCIFKQLITEAKVVKAQPNNSQNHHGNSGGNNNNNNNNNRQRKRSVFTINRMFGSLIGRSSMPPELPSKKHGTVPNLAASMPDVAGSFKSVFKKRSV